MTTLRSNSRLARWAPPAALLAALLVIYWPVLLPGWTFSGADFLQLFLPLKHYSMESWAAGRPPFWNPYSFMGAPILASMQPAALYPPDVMLLAMRGDLMWAMKAQVFLHLCALAMGCYWLYRVAAGGERWGAAMAALAVAGGAFMRFHLEHINQVAALAWAPWILGVAWMALARGRRGALLALPALVALQILAGHPQHVYNTMLVLGGMAVFALAAGPDRRRTLATIGLIALGTLGGAGLAAPQLLPAMELASLSPRAGQSVAEALAFSLPPERLISFVHPRQGLTFENALAYTNMYGEFGCYVGLIPLALALAGVGVMAAWARLGPETRNLMRQPHQAGAPERWRWLWPIGAAACLVMALGGYAKVYGVMAAVLPGMAGFRVPARWLFFAALFLGGAAQYGWLLVCGRAARRQDLKFLSRPGWVGLLTFALLIVDLQVMPPPGPQDRQTQRAMVELTLEQAGRTSASLAGALKESDGRLYRFENADADHTQNNSPEGVRERLLRLQPETHMLTGVPALFGYEQALLPTRAMLALQAHYNRNLRWRDPDAELLALLGVRWIMSDFEVSGRNWRPLPLRSPSALGGRPMMFYENRLWRGAAFAQDALAGEVNWMALPPDLNIPLTLGRELTHDYRKLEGDVFRSDRLSSGVPIIQLRPLAGGNYAGAIQGGKAREEDAPELMTVIWSQTALPGWRVTYRPGTADGTEGPEKMGPLQILGPCHMAFQISKHLSHFELTYIPNGWYRGIWVSFIFLFFYLVLIAGCVRRFNPSDAYAGEKGRFSRFFRNKN